MANIFINYRRSDSITVAYILYNKLLEKKHSAFIDKEAIPIGLDFAAFIEQKIKLYDVMLCLIGNQWLTIKDNNRVRIRKDNDHVRLELAEALRSNTIKVIPVLIDKVQMPDEKNLPSDLTKLSKLNAVEFFSYEYEKSADRVLTEIERTLNLLTSKDLSRFIKIIEVKNDRGVVYNLKSAMETYLLAAHGIKASINFAKLDNDTAYVAKLKKGEGTYILSALYAAEQFGVKFKSFEQSKGYSKKLKTKNEFIGTLKRYTVNSIDELIKHLNSNRPVLSGINIYEELTSTARASTDGLILSLPKPKAQIIGTTSLLISHVDLVKDRIKIAFPWGKKWGDNGFGYFSQESFYKYVDQNKLYAIETVYQKKIF